MEHVDGLDDQAGEDQTDDGFTLVEVVVALGLLSVVATSALSMFVASMEHADGQRERQVAVAVVNDAVERIHSVRSTVTSTTPQTVAGLAGTGQVGGLTSGRTPSDVATAWNATSFPGKADTRPAWDANTPAGPLAVPLSVPSQVGGTTYTTTTLVGTCTLATAAGGACSLTGSGPVVQRVVVVVTWTGAGCSPTCSATSSSLVDGHSDPTWRVAS